MRRNGTDALQKKLAREARRVEEEEARKNPLTEKKIIDTVEKEAAIICTDTNCAFFVFHRDVDYSKVQEGFRVFRGDKIITGNPLSGNGAAWKYLEMDPDFVRGIVAGAKSADGDKTLRFRDDVREHEVVRVAAELFGSAIRNDAESELAAKAKQAAALAGLLNKVPAAFVVRAEGG